MFSIEGDVTALIADYLSPGVGGLLGTGIQVGKERDDGDCMIDIGRKGGCQDGTVTQNDINQSQCRQFMGQFAG